MLRRAAERGEARQGEHQKKIYMYVNFVVDRFARRSHRSLTRRISAGSFGEARLRQSRN